MDIPIDRHDVMAGLFVLSGLVVLVALALFLAGPDLLDLESVRLKTYLPSTFGLSRGVPVTYLDKPVGKVKEVRFTRPEEGRGLPVEVTFTVKGDYRSLIRNDFRTTLEKQQFGGFLSGRILLHPPAPEAAAPGARPVRDGDVLDYMESISIFDSLNDLPFQLKEEILPRVNTLLDEAETFLASMNDPGGDFRVTLAGLRAMSTELSDPEGKLQTTLSLLQKTAAQVADEGNLLMQLLHDREIAGLAKEAARNVRDLSGKGLEAADRADRVLGQAESLAGTGREMLEEARPKASEILERLLALQEETLAVLRDVRRITTTLARSSDAFPSILDGARLQMKELEDITQAVKNIFFIRWNLEDRSMEDPVLRTPLRIRRPMQDKQEKE